MNVLKPVKTLVKDFIEVLHQKYPGMVPVILRKHLKQTYSICLESIVYVM